MGNETLLYSLDKHDPCIDTNDLINEDNLEKFVTLYILKKRDIAISSMKEGMTLGGAINVQKLLSLASTRVIDRFLFSYPELSTQDIIDILEPQYSRVGSNSELVQSCQENCFQKVLPEAIRKLSMGAGGGSPFLENFLKCCTGHSYLPHLTGFRIIVKFRASLDNDALPTTDPCHHELNIPAYAYFNVENVLISKISLMLEKYSN